MTFSIVARSDDGESWGVAVASKFLAVGSAVPAAVAQVGAIATQAHANVAYKGIALSHLDEGATADIALQCLLEEDPDGNRLTLDDLVAIAVDREPVSLTAEARARVTAARAVVDSFAAGDQPVYGINTGFGNFAEVRRCFGQNPVPAAPMACRIRDLSASHGSACPRSSRPQKP